MKGGCFFGGAGEKTPIRTVKDAVEFCSVWVSCECTSSIISELEIIRAIIAVL